MTLKFGERRYTMPAPPPPFRGILFADFERELHAMKPRSRLYEVVKAEMQLRGRWRNLPRGKRFETGSDPRRGQIKTSK